MARLTEDELLAIAPGESTIEIRSRVVAARKRREKREDSEPTTEPAIRTLDSPTRALLKRAFAAEPASARAFHRTLGVARSIADLEGAENIDEVHVAEALQLRKPVWA